jgi:hypothetical protein
MHPDVGFQMGKENDPRGCCLVCRRERNLILALKSVGTRQHL